MKRFFVGLYLSLLMVGDVVCQHKQPSCNHDYIIQMMSATNPDIRLDLEKTESFISHFLQGRKDASTNRLTQNQNFIIPVVIHVFHNGEDGKIELDQAQSGLDIINKDFNGENDDWSLVASEFEDVKASLDIEFKLASIDPDGNPTTGVNYYDNEDAMYNQIDLFQYAWDNFKYLNIYLPKYVEGEPSNITGYGYYPDTYNTSINRGGILFSSVRWGYGEHSELEEGDEWASVATHEVGHWLNLYHTFLNGCESPGDYVSDTPPTKGGELQLSGCGNNDLSCGVPTNGENYMDYNLRCKKMFTKGQVDRMIAALHLDSRKNLWAFQNLFETGCITSLNVDKAIDKPSVFPNPAENKIYIHRNKIPAEFIIFDISGTLVLQIEMTKTKLELDISGIEPGTYFYFIKNESDMEKGKFIVR